MTAPRTWTDSELEQLTAFWTGGMPVKDIAHHFNTTEGTISGKRDRMGLPPRGGYIGATARWAAVPHKSPAKGSQPAQKRPPVIHPDMIPVTLTERTGCAFPVNDGRPYLFCDNPGRQYGESIYCEAHSKIMVRQYV